MKRRTSNPATCSNWICSISYWWVHSTLFINDKFDCGGPKGIAHVGEKLDGVDYVFLDEVSMLSCHNMYRISAQIAKAFNIHDIPFGGKNTIFSGDFAQLPPVNGKEASLAHSVNHCHISGG